MDIHSFQTSKQIKNFCVNYHIQKLSFFGSVVREDFGHDSDVDVLVRFDPNHVPGLSFFAMEDELSRILGRKADLQTINFLSPQIRNSVLSEAIKIYEQTQS